ncbi:aminoglycoside phosphotransferase family protein [Pedobacter aquatilis]|uniref:phosphotransferase enzyme family protein n=1 Tax=Pedobacter aquatilis TaxID=351343 RepID=UPI00292E94F2|nr:aminoglycoside phosphotransferase family protein [Pedobacter aquatilis]
MIEKVLKAYGLEYLECEIEPFGNGLINQTWKVSAKSGKYILQKVNTNVFHSPQDIASNTLKIKKYLDRVSPQYLFIAPATTTTGLGVFEDNEAFYRLFPFVADSFTVDAVTEANQAYHAAKQFGKFTRILEAFNPHDLKVTIPDFHNLSLRAEQFTLALENGSQERLKIAKWAISQIETFSWIADQFKELLQENSLKTRVTHHDTKINNVLLHVGSGIGLSVIDLDTVMPGYFISDVGDMMRTYLSPVNEEETLLDKIMVRNDVFLAIYKGYMEEMRRSLTIREQELFIYSGQFMIYMQALRFLTDYLNNDIYYPVSHGEHNLMRAKNQITLLIAYTKSEEYFKQIIKEYEADLEISSSKIISN